MSRSGLEMTRAREPSRIDSKHLPTVTAHAGSLHTMPNTPESFSAALAFPVDYLEADVRFTPDNVAYLAHDALPVSLQWKAMSLADLLKLAAPCTMVRLNLDLKEFTGIREMTECIKRSGMGSRVLLTGVTIDVAPRVRGEVDGLPYMLNASPSLYQRLTTAGANELARTIRDCGAVGLNVHHLSVSRRLARSLSAAGLPVSVWTVDGASRLRRMLRLHVDNITTCRIDRLLALRDRRAP